RSACVAELARAAVESVVQRHEVIAEIRREELIGARDGGVGHTARHRVCVLSRGLGAVRLPAPDITTHRGTGAYTFLDIFAAAITSYGRWRRGNCASGIFACSTRSSMTNVTSSASSPWGANAGTRLSSAARSTRVKRTKKNADWEVTELGLNPEFFKLVAAAR